MSTSTARTARKCENYCFGRSGDHVHKDPNSASISEDEAALLDFLRRAGSTSELSDDETLRKTLALFSEKDRFERLLKVADTEPPRVRDIIGAITGKGSERMPPLSGSCENR